MVLLVLLGLAPAARAQGAAEGLGESLHAIRLARGFDLNVLISRRIGTGDRADLAVLLFPGYPGVLRLREEAGKVAFELNGNFLIRARRHLNSERVFTVAVDCPVDEWADCGDAYRSSSRHVADIADVVAWVREKHGARQVYVVGTSYGTVSTSFLARGLEGRIDGAIHTATFTDPRSGSRAHGVPMAGFDWSRTKVPQLFVHHREDPCGVTRYSSVAARRKDVPLITVEGATHPRGDACAAFTAHGFVGRERQVMLAIHEWIVERRVTAVVD